MNQDRYIHRRQAGLTLPKKRIHCISVRLSTEELALLDARRGLQKRGAWVRAAALSNLPPVVPELNREAWIKLARSASNLNQLVAHLNASKNATLHEMVSSIDTIQKRLIGFRNALLGHFDEGDES